MTSTETAEPALTEADEFALRLTQILQAAELIRTTILDDYQPNVVVKEDDGVWEAWLDQLSAYGEGPTRQAAMEALVGEVETYAADWVGHLWEDADHAGNRELVWKIKLSTSKQLLEWLDPPKRPA